MKERVTQSNIKSLKTNQVFVFGSNLQGEHIAGAAKFAHTELGATWGTLFGPTGLCFAIPTVDLQGHMSVEEIQEYVDKFIEYAEDYPEDEFLVTEIGCGLAGFNPEQIAPLFTKAVSVENIHLPEKFWSILDTPIKTPVENFVETVKDKSILFIENDMGLYNGLDVIEGELVNRKIKYNCLFDVSGCSMEYIQRQIEWADVIIYQTTWMSEISKQITDFLLESKSKKIIIENHISDPTWFYKISVVHDMYILNVPPKAFEEGPWEFFKLSEKPYWNYRNKFDK